MKNKEGENKNDDKNKNENNANNDNKKTQKKKERKKSVFLEQTEVIPNVEFPGEKEFNKQEENENK